MKLASENHIIVLHVIDSAGFGGGERYILDIIKHASLYFHHCVVLPHPGRLKPQLDAAGIPHAIINMERRFSLKSVMDLTRFIRDSNATIIHSHGYRANIYSRMAAVLARKIHVCTVHVSLYDYLDTPLWLRRLYLIMERVTAVATRRFICISEAMVNDTLRLGVSEERIVRIPNGVDISRFYPRGISAEEKKQLGITDSSPVIGTVGRMVTEKGQIYLVSALTRLKSIFPGLICLFVGEGPLLSTLKTAARESGVADVCKFIGVHDDLENVYPVMDLFVLPSIREPFGLVLLEAMASGVPVIATNSGGPLDFIKNGENGVLVPEKDAAALALAIGELLDDDKKKEQVAMMGHKMVLDRFAISHTVLRIEDVYRALVKSTKGNVCMGGVAGQILPQRLKND